VIRRHRLLELFLTKIMGYSIENVHKEAEVLEHVISEDFVEKMNKLLGNPKIDPHGDYIPTKDGKLAKHHYIPMTEVTSGDAVIIKCISDTDSEMVIYMKKNRLLPETTVKIIDKEPFEGPIKIRIDGHNFILGYKVARSIFVDVL